MSDLLTWLPRRRIPPDVIRIAVVAGLPPPRPTRLPPPPLERKPRLAIILWAVSEGAMRRQCIYTATLFAALIAPAIVVASERVDICAQYSATGDSYHVAAISTNGSELNEATNTLNYDSLSSYIVISWPDDETTVIEMDAPFSGPTYVQTGGTDQEGHLWEISAYSPVRVSEAQSCNNQLAW